MKRAWVYILRCADDSYYVGSTTNIQKRIAEHTSGLFGGYTAARKPITPLWSQEFDDIRFAIEAERQIKKWARAKKEALMRGDFKELNLLSRSSSKKSKEPNSLKDVLSEQSSTPTGVEHEGRSD